jgi:hypothetical protein
LTTILMCSRSCLKASHASFVCASHLASVKPADHPDKNNCDA